MDLFYKEIFQAKNGSPVPIFKSEKAAHSKYDPEREAENFLAQADGLLFAVIYGAGGGYHIAALLKRNPACKAVVVEKSAADLEFLKKSVPCVRSLFENPNVIFCAADKPGQLESLLINNYFPAWHGDLQAAALRPWADEAGGLYEELLERTKKALKTISADFSVQARFGGHWQRNIFCNLKVLKKIQESAARSKDSDDFGESFIKKIKGKTAAVIAAGPTLDQTIEKIAREPQKYWTVAADTSYKILRRRNIRVDAVVSIDAQYLSAEHFDAPLCDETIFVLDLAGNPSIANFAFERGAKIVFFNGGHPLISLAEPFCQRPFVRLQSGGGTVAIAAADFARQCGFEKIEIFGADFGYSCGKPYAKGSYLDDLYGAAQNRAATCETAFSRLMFRTPLKKDGRGFLQNEVLLSYQNTMEEFLGRGNFCREQNLYKSAFAAKAAKGIFLPNALDFLAFKKAMSGWLKAMQGQEDLSPQAAPLLPGMARFRTPNAPGCGQNKISTKEAKKLALNKILLYNDIL